MILHRRALLAGATALGAVGALPARAQSVAEPTPRPTAGGKGGRIIRVTTLKPEGPGSITEAIKAKGKRIIVFEVGGVIDLGMKSLRIDEPFVTIAGQTAPKGGVTFIKGGFTLRGNDVLIQHIAVRPGEAGQAKKSGWECDGISAYAADNILVENCSISWATDEGLSASGPRFGTGEKGKTVDEWRAGTSSNILFRRNIVAEGLSNSTHSKGEHSKGSLIHDNVRNAMIEQSLYAHNMERNVLFKGGAQGVMQNCVVHNPGKRFAHYNLHEGEWGEHAWQAGDVQILGNIFQAGPSTDPKAAAFMLGGEGELELSMIGNIGRDGHGGPLAPFAMFGSKKAVLTDPAAAPKALPVKGALEGSAVNEVLHVAGMRPWERDPIDARIISDVVKGTGKIIDSEQDVGGYPVRPETKAAFVEAQWNLDTMERR